MVRLEPASDPPEAQEADQFLAFVARRFHYKRKTLRNNLAEFYRRELVDLWPEAGLRAEQVSLEGFVEIFR